MFIRHYSRMTDIWPILCFLMVSVPISFRSAFTPAVSSHVVAKEYYVFQHWHMVIANYDIFNDTSIEPL